MRKISVLILVFALLLVFTSLATAGPVVDRIMKNKEVVIGTAADYPPFNAKAKDGRFMGLDIDLGTMIAGSINVKPRFVQMPFSELIPAIESGKIDMIISAMTILPERNVRVAFVGPYFITGQSIIVSKQTALKIDKLRELNNPDFSIAVPAGTTSEQSAKINLRRANIVVAKDMVEAMQLLLNGKVKAVMTDTATAGVETYRQKDKQYVSTPPLTYEPLGIAIPGNDPLFENLLTNIMNTIKTSGDLDMLVNKWFKDASWLNDLK